jgi:hypothetical protein
MKCGVMRYVAVWYDAESVGVAPMARFVEAHMLPKIMHLKSENQYRELLNLSATTSSSGGGSNSENDQKVLNEARVHTPW